jgi:GDP-L-fucose synthase
MTRPRIFLAGHKGMVGSALLRRLSREDFEIITADRKALDLREQSEVRSFFGREKPNVAILAAARVGGILANDSYPADFLSDNLAIEMNVID